MKIKILLEMKVTYVFQAQHHRREDQEEKKQDFWETLLDVVTEMPQSESRLVRGDPSGHVRVNFHGRIWYIEK